MATSNLKFTLFTLILCSCQASLAQLPSGNMPYDIKCDGGIFDFKKEQFNCHNIVITQGDFTLKAGEAQSTSLDLENAVWTFKNQITINGRNTRVAADEAVVVFADELLQNVRVIGRPATFQQVLSENDDLARGRGNTIIYDLTKDIVTLSENASLSQGDDQITGEVITYDVKEERVIADSNGQEGNRVHIVITPSKDEQPEP